MVRLFDLEMYRSGRNEADSKSEMYRSGRNEADSKSVDRSNCPGVRIPPSP